MEKKQGTSFHTIYNSFLNLITDDMYLEWSEDETYADLKNIFLSALSSFEFPRFRLYDYVESGEVIDRIETEVLNEETDEIETKVTKVYSEEDYFNCELTREEINILAHLMIVEWMNRQLASIDVVRQAYSSRDFEFTSQANHMDKLIKLKESFSAESRKLQRLYTRRKMNSEGFYVPNYAGFGGKNNAH